MTQSAFATHMGVNRSYVTQLKQAGRLVFVDGGRVDVEASLIRIKETSDPNRDDVSARHAEERGASVSVTVKSEKNKVAKVKDPNQVTFSDGRAKEQHYKALQAELEYKKTIGEYVLKQDMKAAVGDLVTTFRQSLENMPHRIGADLVGKDLDFIRLTIKQEVHSVLSGLERGFSERIAEMEGSA